MAIKCNIGEVEKTVRALLGLPIVAGGFYARHFSELWSQILLWFGLWLLMTAAFSWCPMSWVLSIFTRKSNRA